MALQLEKAKGDFQYQGRFLPLEVLKTRVLLITVSAPILLWFLKGYRN